MLDTHTHTHLMLNLKHPLTQWWPAKYAPKTKDGSIKYLGGVLVQH